MLKLSIITVNLNNCKGLLKTIESVLIQTFSDFEYIIIDGGSDDGSMELIKSFTNSIKITYWVSEKDSGIYNAMNKGIRQAQGEYLLFLNSGDFLVNEKVLEVTFMQNFSEDIIVGDCNVSQKGKVIFHSAPPDNISFASFYGGTIPHQAAFIRLDLFERMGYYSEKYRIHADLEFFIRTLIIHNCTYRHLPVTISDYNLEGISGNKDNDSISIEEYGSILNSLIPPRIVADYEIWNREKKEMAILYWVKTKPLINTPLIWIFSLASTISKWNKKHKFKP